MGCSMKKVPVRHTSGYAFFYWSLAAIFYLYEMVLRASTGVMVNDLRDAFGLDAQKMGLLSATYYWAYTPLQIPCGLILDRVGARRLITFSCVICATGAYVFGSTENIYLAGLARFSIGAGSACAFISSLSLIMGWFSPSHFSLMAGMTNMMGCIGGTFAGEPLAWLSNSVGWQKALIYLGYGGFLLAALTWLGIRDPEKKDKKNEPALLDTLWNIMGKKQIWLSGIIGGLLYLPISAFNELWAVPFLQSTYQIDSRTASMVPMVLYVGMGFGGPAMAYVAEKIKSYRLTLQLTAGITAILFLLMAFTRYFPFPFAVFLAGLIGFVMGGQVLAFSVSKNAAPIPMGGTASAFTNALIMFFGLLFQPILGMVLDQAWHFLKGESLNGIAVYTPKMYMYAILAFPICLAFGLFLTSFLKEQKA